MKPIAGKLPRKGAEPVHMAAFVATGPATFLMPSPPPSLGRRAARGARPPQPGRPPKAPLRAQRRARVVMMGRTDRPAGRARWSSDDDSDNDNEDNGDELVAEDVNQAASTDHESKDCESKTKDAGTENGGDDTGMQVFNKKARRRGADQAGDLLPFDVSVISPPPRVLGQFHLDARTHCGDIVEHRGAHFEVKSVRLRYKLLGGRYQVIGKAIEVKSLARKAIETYLERTLRDS